MTKTKLSKKNNNFKKLILRHVSNNIREYAIVTIIFLIGIILGVIFVNNSNIETQSDIKGYIEGFIESLKNNQYQIDKTKLLKTSMIENAKLAIIIWIVGSTIIGKPLTYAIVAYRGYCIGYTISSIIAVLGVNRGIVFCISSLLLQNIIIIPVLLALNVSGIIIYKSIMNDKRRENVKFEIMKHTIFSIIMLLLLLIAAFIEAYISSSFVMMTINYV